MSIFSRIDDKFVPLYRIMWVSATPHFCGDEDCQKEGCHEVRLEQGETLWASADENDKLLGQLESWQGGLGPAEPEDGDDAPW